MKLFTTALILALALTVQARPQNQGTQGRPGDAHVVGSGADKDEAKPSGQSHAPLNPAVIQQGSKSKREAQGSKPGSIPVPLPGSSGDQTKPVPTGQQKPDGSKQSRQIAPGALGQTTTPAPTTPHSLGKREAQQPPAVGKPNEKPEQKPEQKPDGNKQTRQIAPGALGQTTTPAPTTQHSVGKREAQQPPAVGKPNEKPEQKPEQKPDGNKQTRQIAPGALGQTTTPAPTTQHSVGKREAQQPPAVGKPNEKPDQKPEQKPEQKPDGNRHERQAVPTTTTLRTTTVVARQPPPASNPPTVPASNPQTGSKPGQPQSGKNKREALDQSAQNSTTTPKPDRISRQVDQSQGGSRPSAGRPQDPQPPVRPSPQGQDGNRTGRQATSERPTSQQGQGQPENQGQGQARPQGQSQQG